MAKLSAIRDGLKANLDSLQGVQVSAYMLSNPTPPCLEVFPSETLYDLTMGRGFDEWKLTVRMFVGVTTDVGAQRRLDDYLASAGSLSVKTKLESDKTLGGAAQTLRVESCSGYRVYQPEGRGPLLGAEWSVSVLATGT